MRDSKRGVSSIGGPLTLIAIDYCARDQSASRLGAHHRNLSPLRRMEFSLRLKIETICFRKRIVDDPAVGSAVGQEDEFPPLMLSVRCRLGHPTVVRIGCH